MTQDEEIKAAIAEYHAKSLFSKFVNAPTCPPLKIRKKGLKKAARIAKAKRKREERRQTSLDDSGIFSSTGWD